MVHGAARLPALYLNHANRFCWRAPVTLVDIESYPHSFYQGPVAIRLYHREMDEDVAAAVHRDEAVAFIRVEPLDCAPMTPWSSPLSVWIRGGGHSSVSFSGPLKVFGGSPGSWDGVLVAVPERGEAPGVCTHTTRVLNMVLALSTCECQHDGGIGAMRHLPRQEGTAVRAAVRRGRRLDPRVRHGGSGAYGSEDDRV